MKLEVNKPVENPKLSSLFQALRSEDISKKQELCEAIAEEIALNAFLLSVFQTEDDAVEHKDDGTCVVREGSNISFAFLSSGDGTAFLPVYTDWKELRKCEVYKNADVNTLILSFDDMVAITAGKSGIVVNPYSDNFVIQPENVTHMKQRKEEFAKGFYAHTLAEETPVLIGKPADYPSEMVEAMRKLARKNKTIKAMWLKLMAIGTEKSYLVIVDFSGDLNATFKGMSEAIAPYLKEGMHLDLVPYSDRIGKQAAEGEPFYRRKRGLFG